jgi:tetratricopeptide (TPR) repeat protein
VFSGDMKRAEHYRRFPPDCHADVTKTIAAFAPISTYFRTLFSLILPLVFASFCLAADPAPSPPSRIDRLIAQLASEDAAERSAASVQLLQIGRPARPAILRAAHGDDPDLRDRAAQILLQLPWYLPSDPPPLQQILKHYGIPDVNQRRTIITSELDRGDAGHDEVLIRLLNEDPSIDVRWTIVGLLRRLDDGTLFSRFASVQPPQDDPPMLALCAYARIDSEPDDARKMLARCANLEFANPSEDPEFDYVIELLCDFDVQDKNYAGAADLRRKQYARGSTTDESGIPVPLLELFALQADHGPIAGLDTDLQLAGSAAQSPKIQYSLYLLYSRTGKKDQADTARAAAFTGSHTRAQRYAIGEYLADHGWDDLAQAEFNQLFQMTDEPDGSSKGIEVNAHFQLAAIAIRRNDDFAAAKNTELALRAGYGSGLPLIRTDARGNVFTVSTDDVWAEVHWHYLRAAQSVHDDAAVAQQLDALLALKPSDAQIAIDAVPILKQRGRLTDAETLFNHTYLPLKAKVEAHPHDPDLLNSIAWLCAETSEHLPEALNWATQAVAILPHDAAVIDTLADVNYRLGHNQKAAELEAQALQYEPGDSFMESQLAKFRAAAATQPSPHP